MVGKFWRYFGHEISIKYLNQLIDWGRILKHNDARLYVCDESYMKYTDEYLNHCK